LPNQRANIWQFLWCLSTLAIAQVYAKDLVVMVFLDREFSVTFKELHS
jgi:hypothetical protein